jgi:hypothetical protein
MRQKFDEKWPEYDTFKISSSVSRSPYTRGRCYNMQTVIREEAGDHLARHHDSELVEVDGVGGLFVDICPQNANKKHSHDQHPPDNILRTSSFFISKPSARMAAFNSRTSIVPVLSKNNSMQVIIRNQSDSCQTN